MGLADYGRLVALAAIWGASFIFMRIAAPVLGPLVTADLRVLIAGLALAAWLRATGFDAEWRRYWKQYAAIGTVNSGLPFLLYAFAALHVTAPLMAVLNSSAPMFGAIAGALWLGERMTALKLAGLAAGAAGVAVIFNPGAFPGTPMFGWAVAACLAAGVCYGVTGAMLRWLAPQAKPRGIAVGSQFAAGIVLLPPSALFLPDAAPSLPAVASILALGIVCGAIAYLLYFRLIAEVGATRALTVTYLIPLFGIAWGALFLGEALPASALAGGVLILAGTVLVTRG
ncbi:MAG: DMT family transporter [Burkholderiales bacterium]